METGICQGTILAPLLFSIYTRELYYILSDMGVDCHFYADDTQIMMEVGTESHAQQSFDMVFAVVESWMSKRKLKLNADKTEYIIIGNRSGTNIFNNLNEICLSTDRSIELSEKVRNLGVWFDRDLSLEPQLQNARRKIIGNLVNISRIAKFINKDSRTKLIHGLVLSRIDFCNSLYAGLPNNRLRPLQMLLHSSARLIMGMPRFSRERITPVLIQLHFLPIKARIMYKMCLLVFKALKYDQPKYLSDLLHYRQPFRSLRGTGSKILEEPIIAQSSYSNRCFSFCAPRMFNSLPENLRTSATVENFKCGLKTFLFQQAYNLESSTINPDFSV